MKHDEAVRLIDQAASALRGKRDAAEFAVTALLAEGHLLIEDVPGVGKTTLVLALASALGCTFGRIQFTPDTMPSDIFGVSIYNAESKRFEYKQGAIMKNVILADEINRTPPKTQSALLEAMEERQVTVDGVTYPLPEPFFVAATQNPVEHSGTFPLPEAQLDRFMMRISIGYPDAGSEEAMISDAVTGKLGITVGKIMDIQELIALQREVRTISVCSEIVSYMTALCGATRQNEQILLGASPRAAIALARASQAAAYIGGRDYVTPDDVKKVFKAVMTHRIIPSARARAEGFGAERIAERVMRSVKVPAL